MEAITFSDAWFVYYLTQTQNINRRTARVVFSIGKRKRTRRNISIRQVAECFIPVTIRGWWELLDQIKMHVESHLSTVWSLCLAAERCSSQKADVSEELWPICTDSDHASCTPRLPLQNQMSCPRMSEEPVHKQQLHCWWRLRLARRLGELMMWRRTRQNKK